MSLAARHHVATAIGRVRGRRGQCQRSPCVGGATRNFSLFMCLLWIEMGAVDVAFTEAAVGAGITTVFFVITVFKTERMSKD